MRAILTALLLAAVLPWLPDARPAPGTVLWRLKGNWGAISPRSPCFADGTLYVSVEQHSCRGSRFRSRAPHLRNGGFVLRDRHDEPLHLARLLDRREHLLGVSGPTNRHLFRIEPAQLVLVPGQVLRRRWIIDGAGVDGGGREQVERGTWEEKEKAGRLPAPRPSVLANRGSRRAPATPRPRATPSSRRSPGPGASPTRKRPTGPAPCTARRSRSPPRACPAGASP